MVRIDDDFFFATNKIQATATTIITRAPTLVCREKQYGTNDTHLQCRLAESNRLMEIAEHHQDGNDDG